MQTIYIKQYILYIQLTFTGTGSDGMSEEKNAEISETVTETIDAKLRPSVCWERDVSSDADVLEV